PRCPGPPGSIPFPSAAALHLPRLARRSDRGHPLALRACTSGVRRRAGHATGGIRVRRGDGGERAAAPGGIDLYEESDAGGVLGADHSRGGGLPAGGGLVETLRTGGSPMPV